MGFKRCARRLSPDDSEDLGLDSGSEGSDYDEEEEGSRYGEDTTPAEPKETRLKRAAKRSPPSPEECPTRDPPHEDSAGAPKRGEKRSPLPRHGGKRSEKKSAVERSWSYDDELKILNALVVHAQSHDGDLPDSLHLLQNLTFDKVDANEYKLNGKIRKLRARFRKFRSQGCPFPSDNHSRRVFELSEIIWGQVEEDERVEPKPTYRDFSVLSKLYPHLAKEIEGYAKTHSLGDMVLAMFMTIGDDVARYLDAKCKRHQIAAFKLELGQARLTNELLSALSHVRPM